jgi:predicted enzyme related to lactoylglutathione lyase
VEVQNELIEELVDTYTFMFMMGAKIVQELGIMHLVFNNENYKMASSTVTKALGKITNPLVKVGNIQCNMVFLIVDTNSYDIFLGLEFFMKIGAVVDARKV